MKRGRIQLGLILGLLSVGVLASATVAVFGPASSKRGPGVAFAQDGGGAMPAAGSEQQAEADPASPAADSNTESDVVKKVRAQKHGPDVYDTHAGQTPSALQSFQTTENGMPLPGIKYAGVDSPVAQTTEKIRSLDIAAASREKYRIAEEYLGTDNGRKDPLEITDAVPEELRLLYAGEDDLSDLSDAELEQLMLSGIRNQLAYLPIHVVGVIDNGVNRMALISFYGGRARPFQLGSSIPLGSFPIDPRNSRRMMTMTMRLVDIKEDYVEMHINSTYTLANGYTETLEPVVRRFYLHTVF